MAKYHVYGLGNALVDTEFKVENDFLSSANIEKGLMTLVDENRQVELLRLLDGQAKKQACGGSAANTIIAVSQLGGNSYYSCKVSNDETGSFYYKDLVSQGVTTNLTDKRCDGTTGRCMVFVTPDADRTMNTYLGITGSFSKEEISPKEINDSDIVYIEGYLVCSPTGKEAAIYARKLAKENNKKVALTFSDPGVVAGFKDGFKEIIGDGIDILFCNEDEALAYTGAASTSDAYNELQKISKIVVITLGPKGALIGDNGTVHNINAIEVNALDTNGAGDLFAGCFMYGMTQGYDLKKCGELSVKACSKLITQYGPRLEKNELLNILKETI